MKADIYTQIRNYIYISRILL